MLNQVDRILYYPTTELMEDFGRPEFCQVPASSQITPTLELRNKNNNNMLCLTNHPIPFTHIQGSSTLNLTKKTKTP